MFTIAVISQKGGAGKTILACAIAVASERAGRAAVLIDLDPQGSAAHWGDLRAADTPVIISTPAARLIPVIAAARDAGAQVAIIDTAPHVADAALAAARAADIVIIPCRASAADLYAIGASINLARISETRAVAVLNAAPVRNPLLGEARTAIDAYGIEAAPVIIHQRIDHVHAFTAGLTASEYAPRSKAAAELDALFHWIIQGALSLDGP